MSNSKEILARLDRVIELLELLVAQDENEITSDDLPNTRGLPAYHGTSGVHLIKAEPDALQWQGDTINPAMLSLVEQFKVIPMNNRPVSQPENPDNLKNPDDAGDTGTNERAEP